MTDFYLSLRDVEDLLGARAVVVSYETIRAWAAKFGSQYDKVIRRDRPSAVDKWHLDEVVLPINGQKYWLWRAVDSKGDVLDILVQSQRNKQAATRFFASSSRRLANREFSRTNSEAIRPP
jgi:putative transposase